MHRRNILKLITIGSAIPLLPGKSLTLFRGIHASLPASPKLKILNAHQDATVTALAELILPQTDTPGAKAARVNEFIDLIIADWYSPEEQAQFFAGLVDLDVRTQSLFNKTFVEATNGQQSTIVRALGEQMAEEAAALVSAPVGYRGSTPDPDGNFYFMFRDLTLTGYFTSEIGFTQQLHEEIIPGHFEGCAPVVTPQPAKGS